MWAAATAPRQARQSAIQRNLHYHQALRRRKTKSDAILIPSMDNTGFTFLPGNAISCSVVNWGSWPELEVAFHLVCRCLVQSQEYSCTPPTCWLPVPWAETKVHKHPSVCCLDYHLVVQSQRYRSTPLNSFSLSWLEQSQKCVVHPSVFCCLDYHLVVQSQRYRSTPLNSLWLSWLEQSQKCVVHPSVVSCSTWRMVILEVMRQRCLLARIRS